MARKPYDFPQDLDLEEALCRLDLLLDMLYAHGVGFGTGAGDGMVAGSGGHEVEWDGVTAQQEITHNLGTVPQGYIVLNQSTTEPIQGRPDASEVTGQSDDWTTEKMYLVSSVAQKARIFVVK